MDPDDLRCESALSERSKDQPIFFKDGFSPHLDLAEASVSGRSLDLPINFKDKRPTTDINVSSSTGPSCLSLKSSHSRDWFANFKNDPSADPCETEDLNPEPVTSLRVPSGQWTRTDLDATFNQLEEKIVTFVKDELKRLHKVLWSDYPEENQGNEEEQTIQEAFLNIALDFLRKMKQEPLAECLFSKSTSGLCQTKLKSHLKQKFISVSEGINKEGVQTPLNQIFTDLWITEGGASEVNQEHEVRHIQATSRKRFTPETTIKAEDIFKIPKHKLGPIREEQEEDEIKNTSSLKKQEQEEPQLMVDMSKKMTSEFLSVTTEKATKQESKGTDKQPIRAEQTETGTVRTVLTKGVAGIGKTVLTQKFTLDWAEGKANKEIQLLFPFTFRELNVHRDKPFSLEGLLLHCFSQIKGLCSLKYLKVVFIFDGLDECRLPLDFRRTRVLTEPTESASVEELLVNLIRGDLCPSARLWITTRPAAANQIPAEYISMVTEVQGFTDLQKDQYFMKRFTDKQQALVIISHIKKSQSLYIMCYMPVFCWILSTVLEHLLNTCEGEELPHTFTQMYIHFLVVQAKVKNIKFDGRSPTDSPWTPETMKMLESLGKLAFEQLMKGNLIFYESDLREIGLNVVEIACYSGVFTQVFREEPGQGLEKVYCFVHFTVQECLAAFHVHQTFVKTGVNLLSQQQTLLSKVFGINSFQFYQSAVDRALKSPNGELDLFLRFLLGMSVPSNQRLLPVLQTQKERSPRVNQETVEYIKERLNEGLSTERSINLFHCLNELNDHTLVEQIQKTIAEGGLPEMTPALWSALVFILLSSGSELEVFDLRKYSASPTAFQQLLPVIKVSRKAILSSCSLSQSCCSLLSSVLSDSSSLKHLDLSNNLDIEDSGVEQLCPGLKSASCRLETLSLSDCSLSQSCCGLLSSVLSDSSSLKHLDLSINNLRDSGVEQLCPGLKSASCRLETLRLAPCDLTQSGCVPLASVLSQSFTLTHLDLSLNDLTDSGVELLCESLKTNQRLKILRLNKCWLTQKSCGCLSPVLSSALTLLDLSNNDLEDSGVEQLCSGLKSATCRLETLSVSGCLVSERGGAALASALSSSSFALTELDLRYNHLGASAELLTALQTPHRRLQTLRMKPSGEQFLTPGLMKYSCDLRLDVNTAHRSLSVSEDLRSVRHVEEEQPYPDHPERFDRRPQVLTSSVLEGRCWWEVQIEGCGENDPGWAEVSVCYKTMKRKGDGKECQFGQNNESWTLRVSEGRYFVTGRELSTRPSSSQRVAVYLDVEAGRLFFFDLSSDGVWQGFWTFSATFSQPLVAGFASYKSSVRLT